MSILDDYELESFSSDEKYNWLKCQSTVTKTYLSQYWVSDFFDSTVEKMMAMQKRDRARFDKVFNRR
jgi:hypothetical protein